MSYELKLQLTQGRKSMEILNQFQLSVKLLQKKVKCCNNVHVENVIKNFVVEVCNIFLTSEQPKPIFGELFT